LALGILYLAGVTQWHFKHVDKAQFNQLLQANNPAHNTAHNACRLPALCAAGVELEAGAATI